MPSFKPKVSKHRRSRTPYTSVYGSPSTTRSTFSSDPYSSTATHRTTAQDAIRQRPAPPSGRAAAHTTPRPAPQSTRARRRTAALIISFMRRLRWRHMDWRGKTSVVLGSIFAAMVVLPSGLAVSMHARGEPSVLDWVHSADGTTSLKVYRMDTGSVVTMALNDYLVDVLAAEIDPNAPMPALQSAAVAARTYAVHAMVTPPTPQPTFAYAHGADVTSDGLLDLPMLTQANQETKFKSQQDAVTIRLQQAVASTDGQILTYQGQAISAFTFQLSPGETRDAKDVFGKDIPYLRSVACPDDAKVVQPVTQHVAMADLAESLQLSDTHPNPQQFRITSTDTHGFVKTITYGTQSWSGTDFARLLRLPSAHFTMGEEGGGVVFQVEGIGSDVGMSLHEAQVMAGSAGNKTWQEILGFFYPGTKIDKDTSLLQANPTN